MKNKYKYIHFEEFGEDYWIIRNNKSNDYLGEITWYKQWKDFVFEGNMHCLFNTECLLDIVDFIKQLKDTRNSN